MINNRSNQLEALRNQLNAQSGKQITQQTATTLNQLAQKTQKPEIKIEHLAPKGRMDNWVPHTSIPYIPEFFPITYQATFTTTNISGTYSWVVSPSDTSVVTLTGLLSGPITPETKAPTIQVYVPSTDTIELTFVYTPTHSDTYQRSHTADGVKSIFTHGGNITPTSISPTLITTTPITMVNLTVPFGIGSSIVISTTKDSTIPDWVTGYLENVISWTVIAYYHPNLKGIWLPAVPSTGLLDHRGHGIPITSTEPAYQPKTFINHESGPLVADAPNTGAWVRRKNDKPLEKIKHHIEIIKRLIAKNERTGKDTILYLQWWKVTIDYEAYFDLQTGRLTKCLK